MREVLDDLLKLTVYVCSKCTLRDGRIRRKPGIPKTVFGTDRTIGEAMGCGSHITGRASSMYAVTW